MFGFGREQTNVLHLAWVACFLTFVAWFNMSPFNTTLEAVVGLSKEQIDILMICNVALTIPARLVVGTCVDRFGPKIVFIIILIYTFVVCLLFALSRTFEELLVSRLLMGVTGAGYVVGIKMIAESFPPKKMGTAQGLYAGWGNFGVAAAGFGLVPVAALFQLETGWRLAAILSGALCLIWAGVVFKYAPQDLPPTNSIPARFGNPLEVTSKLDLALKIFLFVPLYGAVMALVWKLSEPPMDLLSPVVSRGLLALIFGVLLYNVVKSLRFNLLRLAQSIPHEEHYEFRQVVVLSLAYSLTFGSLLAVVSMYPEFLQTTYGLSIATAGMFASSFAFFNLFSRAGGGWLADVFGGKRVLSVLVAGAAVGFWLMGEIDPQFPLAGALVLSAVCSLFIQAGNGACFSMVPLIRKDISGRVAGMVGSYGNVGAVYFLVVFSLVSASTFFKIISGFAVLVLVCLYFLPSNKELHVSFNNL